MGENGTKRRTQMEMTQMEKQNADGNIPKWVLSATREWRVKREEMKGAGEKGGKVERRKLSRGEGRAGEEDLRGRSRERL